MLNSYATFDPQRETNLYLLSCVTLFKQLSLYKRYINNNGKVKKELNSTVTNQLSSHLQLKVGILYFLQNEEFSIQRIIQIQNNILT